MKPVIGIIAQGQMGAAVARRLVENGLDVLTILQGRSAQSADRAKAAGMKDVPIGEFCQAGMILSIVPPGDAEGLARFLVPALAAAPEKPIYVDCNAVNPRTVARIAAIIEAAGVPFADAGIIGGPPKAGYAGPTFYLSGKPAHDVAALGQFGLECKVLEKEIGAASALKMSYAGVTKGLTALGCVMILAAARAGTAEPLRHELARSQPALLAWFERQVPSMSGKAYRWVAEMEEIAGFVEEDEAGMKLFESTARFYHRLANDVAGAKDETDSLARFFIEST